MPKTHEERVQVCISRLQEAGLLDSTRSDAGILFKKFFDDKADPEVITKNLLYMHSKGFNFNDPNVQQQLLAGAINALEDRELFFKKGFELKLGAWKMDKCSALKDFYNKNINKDQSSSMYFALQILESNGCFSTSTEAVSANLKENAIKLLVELELNSLLHKLLVSESEKSIDSLPERVATNFIALRKEGYSGIFSKQDGGALWGGISNGLTEKMIRVLENPLDEKALSCLAMDLAFSAINTTFSAASASRRKSSLSAMFLADDVNNLRTSTNFIDCWEKVLNKIKFFDLVAKDNDDQMATFFRNNSVNLTPDVLREAYARLPEAPLSGFNRKLLLLQQGELERTESAFTTADVDIVDPIARIQVALRSDHAPAVQVNWAEILRKMPLENFSSKAIVQRTCLIAVSKLQPQEARKALGLEKLDESQQAILIRALQAHKIKISYDLNYLSGLLKTASAKQGDLLIDYFFVAEVNHIWSNDLKAIIGLLKWVRTNGPDIKEENKIQIEFYINHAVELCVNTMTTRSPKQFKDNDQIRQAWKDAREPSVKTEAEQVYRTVQKLRESKPVDLKAVSQALSDYMAKHPSTAFTVELKKIFGDFFTQYTLPDVATVQISTPAAAVAPVCRV